MTYTSPEWKLAKYWTREAGEATGRDGPIPVTSRGWSNESVEGARVVARDTAQKIAESIVSGRPPRRHFPYGERPLPEPVLHEFQADRDGPTALVTRNANGSTVLNTRDLMFVDIDKEDQPSMIASSIRSLFGKSAPKQTVLTDIQGVAERNNLAVRVLQDRGWISSADHQRSPSRGRSPERGFARPVQRVDSIVAFAVPDAGGFRARLTPQTLAVRFPQSTGHIPL